MLIGCMLISLGSICNLGNEVFLISAFTFGRVARLATQCISFWMQCCRFSRIKTNFIGPLAHAWLQPSNSCMFVWVYLIGHHFCWWSHLQSRLLTASKWYVVVSEFGSNKGNGDQLYVAVSWIPSLSCSRWTSKCSCSYNNVFSFLLLVVHWCFLGSRYG